MIFKNTIKSKLVMIGFIFLLAISCSVAWGKKPRVKKVSANLRPLSSYEILGILLKFPEMVPGMFKDEVLIKKDTYRLKSLFRFSELEDSLLKQLFPTARFYQGWDGKKPRHPYLMAVVRNKRYSMPSNFNWLLLENNLEVNDKNIIELAKAFVVIALEGKEIIFLEGKRIKEGYRPLNIEWDVEIKCRINEEVQTWKFTQARNTPRKGVWVKIGQLGIVGVFINNKPVRSYKIKRASKETEN